MADKKFFMITGMATAFAIAISLYYMNTIYGCMSGENYEYSLDSYNDFFKSNLELCGQKLNPDLKLYEYDKRGKLISSEITLGTLIEGNICIALLSNNNCNSCVKKELTLLRNLGLPQNKMIYIYDTPAHEMISVKSVNLTRFFEFEKGELFPGFEIMNEMPILLYIDNGTVTASCVVTNSTRSYTDEFHNFLKSRLMPNENSGR